MPELVCPPKPTMEKLADFGQILRQLAHLVDVGAGVFRGGIGRRVDDGEERAGILFRREFARGLGEQIAGQPISTITISSVTGR
jgi:hypothetical protein